MDDPSTTSVTEGFGLMFYNARWYDPALGRFAPHSLRSWDRQADSIVPGAENPQAWDRYAYAYNNPLYYTDPSGHWICEDDDCSRSPIDNGNNKNGSKGEKVQSTIEYPTIIRSQDWSIDEKIAIFIAWSLLVDEFGSQDALENALGGKVTFMYLPYLINIGGDGDVVARAYEPLNLITVNPELFASQRSKEWYVLHEIAHLFDMNDSGGNPYLYKSNAFVEAFIPGGCKLAWNGCTGAQWNPTDKGTSLYGLSNGSIEDFADSFASTVLYNQNRQYLSYLTVSRDRMSIINVWISLFK